MVAHSIDRSLHDAIDPQEFVRIQAAANTGDDDATNALALIRGAEEGIPNMAFYLGNSLATSGFGLKKDTVRAAHWFSEAASKGHVKAQRELAHLYEIGDGVNKDIDTAIDWYKKAAQEGDAIANQALEALSSRSEEELELEGQVDAKQQPSLVPSTDKDRLLESSFETLCKHLLGEEQEIFKDSSPELIDKLAKRALNAIEARVVENKDELSKQDQLLEVTLGDLKKQFQENQKTQQTALQKGLKALVDHPTFPYKELLAWRFDLPNLLSYEVRGIIQALPPVATRKYKKKLLQRISEVSQSFKSPVHHEMALDKNNSPTTNMLGEEFVTLLFKREEDPLFEFIQRLFLWKTNSMDTFIERFYKINANPIKPDINEKLKGFYGHIQEKVDHDIIPKWFGISEIFEKNMGTELLVLFAVQDLEISINARISLLIEEIEFLNDTEIADVSENYASDAINDVMYFMKLYTAIHKLTEVFVEEHLNLINDLCYFYDLNYPGADTDEQRLSETLHDVNEGLAGFYTRLNELVQVAVVNHDSSENKSFKKLVSTLPNYYPFNAEKHYWLASLVDDEEKIKENVRAAQLYNKDPRPHLSLFYHYYNEKNYELAERYRDMALQVPFDDPKVLINISRHYYERKNYELAEKYRNEALETWPDHKSEIMSKTMPRYLGPISY